MSTTITTAITECSLASILVLGSLPTAVPCARAHTRAVLTQWGLAGIADTAEIIVSELVANAITHGSIARCDGGIPVVCFGLAADQGHVFIDVWDSSPQPPVIRRDVPSDLENGRGLLLVDAMCETWRWEKVPGWHGKRVWAALKIQ
jgi:anti-sigma regulatory factor (Ser/Thr protein kinase)